MLNSLTLRQQHFLYQRKNLYDQEPSRSSSGETVPEQAYKIPWLEFLTFIPPHRTLSEVAALPRVKSGAAGRPPVGTIAIGKVKIRYRGRMSV